MAVVDYVNVDNFQTFGLGPLGSLLSRLPAERGLRPVTMTQFVA